MLSRCTSLITARICRSYSAAQGVKSVPVLPDSSLETFRKYAFEPASPALLPKQTFKELPAIRKWFTQSSGNYDLNRGYLSVFGSATVPLEFSTNEQFSRIEQPFSFLLDATAVPSTTANIYLAQAPIADLPRGLKDDVPIPELVLKAGKGDLYDSSIWLGQAPTYTPLHRDPNPNLFVQLAGKKLVRLFRPEVGRAILAKVQEEIGASTSETLRGEEMMQGAEKEVLERKVWMADVESEFRSAAWEAELGSGDGLFIPKGWWHSVKSVGSGMNGSVNWWFR